MDAWRRCDVTLVAESEAHLRDDRYLMTNVNSSVAIKNDEKKNGKHADFKPDGVTVWVNEKRKGYRHQRVASVSIGEYRVACCGFSHAL